jgi:hypothetical protein
MGMVASVVLFVWLGIEEHGIDVAHTAVGRDVLA